MLHKIFQTIELSDAILAHLNIVLPHNVLNEMTFFLEAGGYHLASTFSRKTPVVKQTRCYIADDGRKPIILTESSDAYALSAVLGDTSSGLMNVLDGLDCVSFFGGPNCVRRGPREDIRGAGGDYVCLAGSWDAPGRTLHDA